MKPLSGKRYFEAQGRRDQAAGLPRRKLGQMPVWAFYAYLQGYIAQSFPRREPHWDV